MHSNEEKGSRPCGFNLVLFPLSSEDSSEGGFPLNPPQGMSPSLETGKVNPWWGRWLKTPTRTWKPQSFMQKMLKSCGDP